MWRTTIIKELLAAACSRSVIQNIAVTHAVVLSLLAYDHHASCIGQLDGNPYMRKVCEPCKDFQSWKEDLGFWTYQTHHDMHVNDKRYWSLNIF